MSGRRVTLALTLVLALLAVSAGRADGDDTGSSDYTDNQIDLVPTHRTGIEKVLQGIVSAVSPSGGSSGSEAKTSDDSSSNPGFFGKFFGKYIPKPVEKIKQSVKNATAKGFGEILNLVENHFHAIFPGTLWCGGGNIAESENDVGLFERTDACCRAHDNCPENINAGEAKGILLNNGIFTRSACFCDHEFYACLKNVSSVVSNNIGSTYFNILRPQCFSYDYPVDSCAEYGKNRFTEKKCVDYNLDYTRNKTFGWFDNPDY